jgi:EAL domain-containing protein (putative c-di-GMP-specific phosphodiesterase class I)
VPSVASKLAYRIGLAVAEPILLASGTLSVSLTASIGIAVTRERPSAADLIHEADAAMYEAKAAGPGRYVMHSELSEDEQRSRRGTERRLFEALARQEFSVYYQPITDPAGVLVAVEALLRWEHPTRGVVPAAEFIDIAESTGAIVPIGHWVIRQAAAQLARWRSAHPAHAPRLVLCNLGPRELIDADLPRVVAAALAEARLEPSDLGLEIIENHLADPRLLQAASYLQSLGHPLAIDDFGTGYSSLARLVDIPVTYLKIDRSLITGLPDDRRSQTLVRAILTIARELHVDVISEGIETRGQADHLIAAGSALLQGYLIGAPMPADELTALLRSADPAS